MRVAVLLALAGMSASAQETIFAPVPPAVEDSLRFEKPLPEFAVKDIAGREWRLQDLRGKYTLVFVWHTFAARMGDRLDARKREVIHGLPDLQEVEWAHQKVKGSQGIQVLGLCTDYDYTHAPEYMKEKQLTFPVIADWMVIKKMIPDASGHGQFWVIDPSGRLSAPFRSWSLARILSEVQRATLQ